MAICHVSTGQLARRHASICFLALGYVALLIWPTCGLESWYLAQLEVSSGTFELLRRQSARKVIGRFRNQPSPIDQGLYSWCLAAKWDTRLACNGPCCGTALISSHHKGNLDHKADV